MTTPAPAPEPPPERLRHPLTGDVVRIERSALRSAGPDAALVFATLPPARGPGAPRHRHRRLHERFRVLSGAIVVTLDREVRLLGAGEAVEVPPGLAHGFRNGQDAPSEVEITVRPGAGFERFLRASLGLARDGRGGGGGLPRDPRLALLLLDHADILAPGLPMAIQGAALSTLARLLRRAGAERALRPYWPSLEERA